MSNIYISGDSFCAARDSDNNKWPNVLANMLGLKLQGAGFAGQSFWETRKNLLSYVATEEFQNTEYFVFAHTEFSRMLTDFQYSQPTHDPEIYKFYFKYLQSDAIDEWHMHSWFKEIDCLLESKKVINLFCFRDTIKSLVKPKGLNLYPCLFELSLAEFGIDINTPNVDTSKFKNDSRANHFSLENNQRLAENICEAIQSNQPTFTIQL